MGDEAMTDGICKGPLCNAYQNGGPQATFCIELGDFDEDDPGELVSCSYFKEVR